MKTVPIAEFATFHLGLQRPTLRCSTMPGTVSLAHSSLLVKTESLSFPRKQGQLGVLCCYITNFNMLKSATFYPFANILLRQCCHLHFIFNILSFSLSFNDPFQQCTGTCQDIKLQVTEVFPCNQIPIINPTTSFCKL